MSMRRLESEADALFGTMRPASEQEVNAESQYIETISCEVGLMNELYTLEMKYPNHEKIFGMDKTRYIHYTLANVLSMLKNSYDDKELAKIKEWASSAKDKNNNRYTTSDNYICIIDETTSLEFKIEVNTGQQALSSK